MNKAETAMRCGDAQVHAWRRSWDVPPPPLEHSDAWHPSYELRYARLPAAIMPRSESLKDTVDRVLPYWIDVIAPALLQGQKVLVVAHGNSLCSIVKMLSQLSDDEIVDFEMLTGQLLIHELDETLRPVESRFLGV